MARACCRLPTISTAATIVTTCGQASTASAAAAITSQSNRASPSQGNSERLLKVRNCIVFSLSDILVLPEMTGRLKRRGAGRVMSRSSVTLREQQNRPEYPPSTAEEHMAEVVKVKSTAGLPAINEILERDGCVVIED